MSRTQTSSPKRPYHEAVRGALSVWDVTRQKNPSANFATGLRIGYVVNCAVYSSIICLAAAAAFWLYSAKTASRDTTLPGTVTLIFASLAARSTPRALRRHIALSHYIGMADREGNAYTEQKMREYIAPLKL